MSHINDTVKKKAIVCSLNERKFTKNYKRRVTMFNSLVKNIVNI